MKSDRLHRTLNTTLLVLLIVLSTTPQPAIEPTPELNLMYGLSLLVIILVLYYLAKVSIENIEEIRNYLRMEPG